MDLLKDIQAQIEARPLPGGGWASRNGGRAVTETTCLALLAIDDRPSHVRDRGLRLLLNLQNPDGSWPMFNGDDTDGSWTTALAVVTLPRLSPSAARLDKATRWLASTKGREGHWFWRWKFRTVDHRVQFNPDKYGWPWIPGTVSWVIPTAFSIIALEQQVSCCSDDAIAHRIQLGKEMLQDRECPGGGWNAGNSIVDGAALTPHIDTTAIALLAMKQMRGNSVVAASVRWLRGAAAGCESPYSLSWAALALSVYHKDSVFESCIHRLKHSLQKRLLELNTETLSLGALVLTAAANGTNPFRTRL